MPDIEICTSTFETAQFASRYPIKRIELCAGLSIGGLTPSLGLVKSCLSFKNIEIHTMIRNREGDFCYGDSDIETMLFDIEKMADLGVCGVVFGCLDRSKNIHLSHTKILTDFAKSKGLQVTFHRAFDFVKNFERSLESLIAMGVDRILTSGGSATAFEGLNALKKLVKKAKGRIEMMAGSGINAKNAKEILMTGVDALHFTAHKTTATALKIGQNFKSDSLKIQQILQALQT